jgi:uncharacterized protein (TIGR01777 family)
MDAKTTYRIAMSGETGFIGSHLGEAFRAQGWEIVPLGRQDFKMEPEDLAKRMQGVDIVVNLAGAPVIKRWTEEHKKDMYESRITVTRKLVKAVSVMDSRPKLFISTSAVGYYDTKGIHTEEQHVKADDFLGRLAQDWEGEALKARKIGMRTVIFRFGIVLGRDGGALKQMLIPFKLGLGGTIGDGSQPFSWVHIKDLINTYLTVIENNKYEGIYNLTAPNPTTNRGFTKALSKALCRPALLCIPKFLLRLQLGEGAYVLTKGQTVIPKRLIDSGFTFLFPEIDEAVKDCVS